MNFSHGQGIVYPSSKYTIPSEQFQNPIK